MSRIDSSRIRGERTWDAMCECGHQRCQHYAETGAQGSFGGSACSGCWVCPTFRDAETRPGIDVDDFLGGFRVDVSPAFAGPDMRPSWAAQLLEPHNRRWRPRGPKVLNDDGPIAAISDLLAALDGGQLPERSR